MEAGPSRAHRPRTLYERNPVRFWQGVAALLACASLLSLLLRQGSNGYDYESGRWRCRRFSRWT
jgi:hypothetical protein